MTVQDITTIISTLGFPSVAAGALFWLNMKTSDNFNKTINDMNKIIDNNTETMQKMLSHFENKED